MPRTVPAAALKDTLACATCGLSPWATASSSHHVRAKKPRSSSRRSHLRRNVPGNSSSVKITRKPRFRAGRPGGPGRHRARTGGRRGDRTDRAASGLPSPDLPPEELRVDLSGGQEVLELLQPGEGPELEDVARHSDPLEHLAELGRPGFDVPSAPEPGQLRVNLVERHSVTPVIGAGAAEGHRAPRKHPGNDAGDVLDLIVLRVVSDVEDLPVHHLTGSGQDAADGFADVQDVDEGTPW